MPRTARAPKPAALLDTDFDSLFATPSSEHDDLIAQAHAIAAQKHAAWEQKKKTRDVHFAGVLRREVGRVTTQRAAALHASIAETSELVERLLGEHAENEDAIRRLWSELGSERAACATYLRQARDATRAADAHREAASIRELAGAKHACEESEALIAALGASG